MAQAIWRGTMEMKRGVLAFRRFGSETELLLADFREGLAVDTEGCSGTRLQTADADLDTVRVVPAILFVFDQLQGLIGLLD